MRVAITGTAAIALLLSCSAPIDYNSQQNEGTFLESSRLCRRLSNGLGFEYNVYTYSNGDKLITCGIANGFSQFNNTELYRADQRGAENESCSVFYDVSEPYEFGWWLFESIGSLGPRATYNDAGSIFDGVVERFSANECDEY